MRFEKTFRKVKYDDRRADGVSVFAFVFVLIMLSLCLSYFVGQLVLGLGVLNKTTVFSPGSDPAAFHADMYLTLFVNQSMPEFRINSSVPVLQVYDVENDKRYWVEQ